MTTTQAGTDPATEPAPKPSTGRRVWTGFEGVFGGFRTFILRGNIVELAVGVVIGVAFNALVTGFTTDFIQPLIKVVSGGKALAGTFSIRHQAFQWAAFVNAVVNFLLIAAVLYFVVVLPMNRVNARRAKLHTDNAPTAVPDDIALLTEIRDALVAANRRAAPVEDPVPPAESGEARADLAETADASAVPAARTAAPTRPGDAPAVPSQPAASTADAPPVAPPRRRTRRTGDEPPAS